jgi:signal transduction histidine kinase
MSASALAAIWIAALLPGTAVIVLVLVKRAAASQGLDGARPGADAAQQPAPDGGRAQSGNGANGSHDLLLLRMSHDLRSPLGSLVTLCQLLVEGDAGPLSMKQRQYVEVIRRSGQSVLGLVDDILDLAAVESGRSDIDVDIVDLAALVRQVAESHEAAGREKGIPVQVSLARESLPASADEKRLRHLLERMVEYLLSTTEHGYVELAVDDSAGKALVRVRNTHEGLSESARRTLALAYQDGDDGDQAEEAATPLPIAIAARLARRIGLPIEVRTGDEEGLSLELAVPLAEAGARVSPDAMRPRHAAGARILLVDDDAAERAHVTSRLEEGGYAVTAAASGSEGLALLRDGHFDAVVLDLVMPGMSGLEVLRAARSDERLAVLPFVVLSALYITRSERSVLGPAVASVVRKGDGTADELLRALDRALAPAAQPHAIGDGRHA